MLVLILCLLLKTLFRQRSEPTLREIPQRPTQSERLINDDRIAWCTKPEIDKKRQEYLAHRRAISPNIEQGIYPFKDVKLDRADIEWLLATYDNGRSPVDWNEETQPERKGLDLRGANLSGVDLSKLPLKGMQGGLGWHKGILATLEQREAAAIHLEEADLTETHLEESDLSHAYLEGAILTKAYLRNAILLDAHLKKTNLTDAMLERSELAGADFERAQLIRANLKEANLTGAHLENTIFWHANLEKANLWKAYLNGAELSSSNLKAADLSEAYLRGADLSSAHLEEAKLFEAHLECAGLFAAHLEEADLTKAHLEGAYLVGIFLNSATQLNDVTLGNETFGYVSLADVHWGGVNLIVLNWSTVPTLGDERIARSRKRHDGKDRNRRLDEYQTAVRANRQLAVALQNQGLNEEAARFAYRAQNLRRVVLRRQRKFGQYLLSLFLSLIAGYGYRLWRSFATYLFVIVGFATAFYLLGPTAKLSLSPLDAIIFSLNSFHGRGFSPGENIGLSNPLTIFAAIEAFVGLVIEVTLIATLTQRFFGK